MQTYHPHSCKAVKCLVQTLCSTTQAKEGASLISSLYISEPCTVTTIVYHVQVNPASFTCTVCLPCKTTTVIMHIATLLFLYPTAHSPVVLIVSTLTHRYIVTSLPITHRLTQSQHSPLHTHTVTTLTIT